jgi:uncharacterized protein (DUF2267 family)
MATKIVSSLIHVKPSRPAGVIFFILEIRGTRRPIAMAIQGFAALEHTVQETNGWLKAISEQLHLEDRHHAYSALRAVLHVLRDRLTPDSAAHLAAQLPTLVRGIYYEGWRVAGKPIRDRNVQEFVEHVQTQLPPRFPLDALTVTRGVLKVMWDKLDPGETAKVIDHLPLPLRSLWPEIARRS